MDMIDIVIIVVAIAIILSNVYYIIRLKQIYIEKERELKKTKSTLEEITQARDVTVGILKESEAELKSQLDQKDAEIEKLQKELDSPAFHTIQEYDTHMKQQDEKIQKLETDIAETTTFMKDVLSQVDGTLDGNPVWGFPNEPAFPGAVSISIGYDRSGDDKIIRVQGKSYFDSDTADKILGEMNVSTRYSRMVRALQLQGLGDRLSKELLRSPAIQYTLGYGEDIDGEKKLYALYRIEAILHDEVIIMDL